MMSPATTLLQCWSTLRQFSGPVQDKVEKEETLNDGKCFLNNGFHETIREKKIKFL
jgi:hypothetical protein